MIKTLKKIFNYKPVYYSSILLLALLTISVTLYFLFKETVSKPFRELLEDKQEYIHFDFQNEGISPEVKDSLLGHYLDSVAFENERRREEFTGDKLSILITGLDNRLGKYTNHADANHVLNIWLKSGKMEIISIPRGTWAYAGYDSLTTDSIYNYLANVRSKYQRKSYHKEIIRIAEIDTIDYFVEFGFSQAIGLLELLGYGDKSVQMLRVLRTRKVFGGQEHQRNYNQGQFIRQMILKFFKNIDGISGDLLIHSAMMLMETNLSYSKIKEIQGKLQDQGFPRSHYDIILTVRPRYSHAYRDYNFNNFNTIDTLYKYITKKAKYVGGRDNDRYRNDYISRKVISAMTKQMDKVRKYTAKNTSRLIRALRKFFDRREWYQISNLKKRREMRNELCGLLLTAYRKRGDLQHQREVRLVIELEDKNELLNHSN